jgi:hypothetical protein
MQSDNIEACVNAHRKCTEDEPEGGTTQDYSPDGQLHQHAGEEAEVDRGASRTDSEFMSEEVERMRIPLVAYRGEYSIRCGRDPACIAGKR